MALEANTAKAVTILPPSAQAPPDNRRCLKDEVAMLAGCSRTSRAPTSPPARPAGSFLPVGTLVRLSSESKPGLLPNVRRVVLRSARALPEPAPPHTETGDPRASPANGRVANNIHQPPAEARYTFAAGQAKRDPELRDDGLFWRATTALQYKL
jgi:hypothetical protein